MLNWLDWSMLIGSLVAITLYGVMNLRKKTDSRTYLMGEKELPWWVIGFSVMSTQASAITFLSTPGQAFSDGMRFLQFYLGIPLAMIFICVVLLPRFSRWNVQTAYEFLEQRFDLRVRTLTASLFLLLRGLSSSITLIAPGIILSTLFGWPMTLTILGLGGFVLIYTLIGGSEAVSKTQVQQMSIMLLGLLLANVLIFRSLPNDVGIGEIFTIAGNEGKMKVLDTKWNINERYNIWSGIIAGFFLFLAYFGTDQSQVQRYLSGKSLRESQLGLLFNGLLKVPMQFFVLFTGLMVYIFFMYEKPPVFFNPNVENQVYEQSDKQYIEQVRQKQGQLHDSRLALLSGTLSKEKAAMVRMKSDSLTELRKSAIKWSADHGIATRSKDEDYVFMHFVLHYFPHGVIGLLLAMIFCAAMSSMASEINALATASLVDIYRRSVAPDRNEMHYLRVARWLTLGWGLLIIAMAIVATPFDNLIQAVNILGSLFYGSILGIVLTAIFLKSVQANHVLVAAMISEALVLYCFKFTEISFLWYNVFGCLCVLSVSWILSKLWFIAPKIQAQ